MRILHISDIHIEKDGGGTSTRIMRDELPRYLKSKQLTADLLFVTGDFRLARDFIGADVGTLERAAQDAVDCVKKIAVAAGVDYPRKVFIVPGNHDLTRDADAQKDKQAFKKIIERYQPSDGRFAPDDQRFIAERFVFFNSVSELLHPSDPYLIKAGKPLHQLRVLDDCSLVLMNTAAVCHGDEDHGTIIVGNRDLYDALQEAQELNPNRPVFLLGHHGIETYSAVPAKNEKGAVASVLERFGAVLLSFVGDAHAPQVWDIPNTSRRIPELTSGCLYDDSGKLGEAACTFTTIREGKLSDFEAHVWLGGSFPGWQKHETYTKQTKLCIGCATVPADVATKTVPALPKSYFEGTDNSNRILEGLKGATEPLLLTGIGGMGKSETCRKLFDIVKNGGMAEAGIREIGWVNFSGDLKSSFYGVFEPLPDGSAVAVDDYYMMALSYLKQKGEKLLLIIDNVEGIQDADIEDLRRLPCKVLLTRRTSLHEQLGGESEIALAPLSKQECRNLYQAVSKSSDTPESWEYIDKIVELAGRHTLMLVLLAKQQRRTVFPADVLRAYPNETPDAHILYDRLKSSGFDLSVLAPTTVPYTHRPEVAADRSEQDELVETHCRTVFDLGVSNLTAEQLHMLKLHALLSHEPLLGSELAELLGMSGSENDLVKLADLGWLEQSGDPKRFSMHQIIAATIRATPPPPDEQERDALIAAVVSNLSREQVDFFTKAKDYLPHGEALLTRFGTDETQEVANLYNNIGTVYHNQGDYPRALEYYTRALAIYEHTLGEEHPSTAISYNNIGGVYRSQGAYPLALEYYTRALTIKERTLGKEHPSTATSYNNIGGVYRSQGDYPRALEYYTRALTIDERTLGEEHPDTAISYNNIGTVYHNQGYYPRALEYYTRALTIDERTLGEEHPSTAIDYNNIGEVYRNQGDYPRALEYYTRALVICERTLGEEHPSTATSYNNIGLVYHSQGDYPRALAYCTRALAIFESTLGEAHPNTITVRNSIEAILDRIEDEYDITAYNEAIAEDDGIRIPWEEVKAELGL